MALLSVNPEVLVSSLLSLFQRGSVTYLATRECLDLISGNPDIFEDSEADCEEAVWLTLLMELSEELGLCMAEEGFSVDILFVIIRGEFVRIGWN